jgi:peptidoglycan L-alanyl-D-glutamate endopeptidase CwlK
MPRFSDSSLTQLLTCDIRLQKIFFEVINHWDCKVIEGKRNEAAQKANVTKGVSRTMFSKHVYPLGAPSLAVDVAPCPIVWSDTERFYAFGGFVIGVAAVLNITVRWGGDWDSDRDFRDQKFMDLPHFELSGKELVDPRSNDTRISSGDELEGLDKTIGLG